MPYLIFTSLLVVFSGKKAASGLNLPSPSAKLLSKCGHAFHPDFLMTDLPTTSKHQAMECLDAARAAGLTRVKLGNIHLLHD